MSARHEPMPIGDFVSALEEAGLSAVEFAAIMREDPEHIRRMMLGAEPVTYVASLVATLLTVEAARELAVLHAELELERPCVEPIWRWGRVEHVEL